MPITLIQIYIYIYITEILIMCQDNKNRGDVNMNEEQLWYEIPYC